MIVAPLEFGITAQNPDKLADFYLNTFQFEVVSRMEVDNFPRTKLSSTPYVVYRLQSPYGERLKILGSVSVKQQDQIDENLDNQSHAS